MIFNEFDIMVFRQVEEHVRAALFHTLLIVAFSNVQSLQQTVTPTILISYDMYRFIGQL